MLTFLYLTHAANFKERNKGSMDNPLAITLPSTYAHPTTLFYTSYLQILVLVDAVV